MKYFYYSFGYQLQLKNYGRRHFKLLTNWHVSWDTLYIACVTERGLTYMFVTDPK